MSRPSQVFIAHSAEDSELADVLAASMSRADVAVVRDSEIEAGETWAEGVRRGVEEASDLVLFIPSATAPNRNNAWFEAGAAKALGKRVIAISVSEERLQSLPPRLADVTFAARTTQQAAIVAVKLLNVVLGAAKLPADTPHLAERTRSLPGSA